MKRETTFYATTYAGERIEFETRHLVYPKMTKTWRQLKAAYKSRQLVSIGYRLGKLV